MTIFYYKNKMKRRTSDKIFSEYIRRRDGRCVYAFKCFGVPIDWRTLHCSHWQKRRHEGTRVDPKNCDASCTKCHAYIEDTEAGAKALDEFKLKQLGKYEYDLVKMRALTYQKKDEFISCLIAKELLKPLKL